MIPLQPLKSVIVSVSPSPINPSVYHERIQTQLKQRPGLAVLDGFMNNALRTVQPPPQRSLKNVFDIHVIHVLNDGEVDGPVPHGDQLTFQSAMKHGLPRERIGTFVLVEDLSYDMIETLGTTFDLPPSFFALHLKDTEPFRSGKFLAPESPDIDLLPSYYAKIPFYSLHMCRYYPVLGGIPELQTLRTKNTNVPRGAYHAERLPNVALRERATVFLKKDSEGRWLG